MSLQLKKIFNLLFIGFFYLLLICNNQYVYCQNDTKTIDNSVIVIGKCHSERIEPGKILQVNYFIKNISNNLVTITKDRYRDLAENIIFTDCPIVPLPKLRRLDRSWLLSSYTRMELEPGKEKQLGCLFLNLAYDITLDGTYTFVLQQPIRWDQSHQIIYANSNALTIIVDNDLVDFSNVVFPDSLKKWSKTSNDIIFSLVTDKQHYKEYESTYLRITTKNISTSSLSMVNNTKNVFDVYEITIKTPGLNHDFRRLESKGDVKKVELTLYGKKLMSKKSKEPKPMVTVKPGEEVAETVIVLNRIFDMSEDGIYGLIVSRKFIDENGKEQTVTSDPLPIRVGNALTQDEIDQRIRQEKEKNTKK
jgi:hypothetical protein